MIVWLGVAWLLFLSGIADAMTPVERLLLAAILLIAFARAAS